MLYYKLSGITYPVGSFLNATKNAPFGAFIYWCRLGDCPFAKARDILPSRTNALDDGDSEHWCSRLRRQPTKNAPFGAFIYWCRLGDSNTRPTHYECVALPTELNRQCRNIHKLFFCLLQALFLMFSIKNPADAQVHRPDKFLSAI